MLRGDFTVFPFLSVVQMLMASGRSGVLNAQHPRGGQLWIHAGEIVHARAGGLSGEYAMQLLTSLDEGQFAFEASEDLPEQTLNLRGDLALRQLFQQSEGWRELLVTFNDWSQVPQFAAAWNPGQSVTRSQFRVLSGIEKGLSLSELVASLPQAPQDTLRLVQAFLGAGWIELEDLYG
ncbi:DUF4388 domain-containing protein [Deinococcus lacus]|uniref:DUF4388 domain-containing protein n=1 Tax=Deinococcus lacus TaxID=392561 RepID=A0ABW1YDZ5_9DEIO